MINSTEKEIAAKVTAATKALMEAINAAYEVGLEVSVNGAALQGWGRFEPAGISEHKASKAVRVFKTHELNHVEKAPIDEQRLLLELMPDDEFMPEGILKELYQKAVLQYGSPGGAADALKRQRLQRQDLAEGRLTPNDVRADNGKDAI